MLSSEWCNLNRDLLYLKETAHWLKEREKRKEEREKKKEHPKARKGNRPLAKVIRLHQEAYYKGAGCSPINSF